MSEYIGPSTSSRASGALVGAAVGNALGWRLDPSSRNTSRRPASPAAEFSRWNRSVGSGRDRYQEPVDSGAFNGTISVALALARSLATNDWHRDLTATQIPAIVDAIRGVSDADAAAFTSWTLGLPPWTNDGKGSSAYWSNRSASASIHGIPLTLRSVAHPNPVNGGLSVEVARAAMLTHGHADAQVAAVALAGSLRWLLLLERTLDYGELLAVLHAQVEEWVDEPREQFLRSRTDSSLDDAKREWAAATRRVIELAEAAADQMDTSVFERSDGLGELSASDPGGIETIVGAMYAFSSSATNPTGALAEAANRLTWDPTNGASATGALLGALAGADALGTIGRSVQDLRYLEHAASVARDDTTTPVPTPHRNIETVRDALISANDAEFPTELVDSRQLTVLATTELRGTAPGRRAILRKVAAGSSPSETLYFAALCDVIQEQDAARDDRRIEVGLPVADVATTREFYARLGLAPQADTGRTLHLTEDLVFYQARESELAHTSPAWIAVYLPEVDKKAAESRARRDADGRIRDPDGRTIEFRLRTNGDAKRTKSTAIKPAARTTRSLDRPVFVPDPGSSGYPVREVAISFEYHGSRSNAQRSLSVRSLLQAAASEGFGPLLEVSTRSPDKHGRDLSAFNLTLPTDHDRQLPVEVVFQGGKVFEDGGPYLDIYDMRPAAAKRDPRLKKSGELSSFVLSDEAWPLEPQTAFYDYLYLSAISAHPELAHHLIRYRAFTDIAFDPARSINCQARSAALYVALKARGTFEHAMQSKTAFIHAIGGDPANTSGRLTLFDE